MTEDPFHSILLDYQNGDTAKAIAQLLPKPNSSYDAISSDEQLFPFLVNYFDAALFGGLREAYYATLCLYKVLTQNALLSMRYIKALHRLTLEKEVLGAILEDPKHPSARTLAISCDPWIASERENTRLTEETIQQILTGIDPYYHRVIHENIAIGQRWYSFKQYNPAYAALFSGSGEAFTHPWHTLNYPTSAVIPMLPIDVIPVLFLEPMQLEWPQLLRPLEGHPAVLIFESEALFVQMLQFPEVVDAIQDPSHLLYIMELYPNEQLLVQECHQTLRKATLGPVYTFGRNDPEGTLHLITEALEACLSQSDESLKGDSKDGDWLYHICKRIRFSRQCERLGTTRTAALVEQQTIRAWYDRHKGLPPPGKDLGPLPPNHLANKLQHMASERTLTHAIRIVHVIPQVVDEGHAPSRLLETLLVHHNSTLFEPVVISTERFQFHPLEYPIGFPNSPPTEERAPNRLKLFESLDIKTHILSPQLTFEQTAREVAALLKQMRADVVVFHGPDIIHDMCTQVAPTPLRILFDHGTLPSCSGYDVVIVSSVEGVDIYRDRFAQLNITPIALPFAIDVKAQWQPAPYSRTELGLPEEGMVMTTISNQLDSRLGSDMCQAIAEILQKVPTALYAPLGRVVNETKLRETFMAYGVNDRVYFLGSVIAPTQYARSMQLYLNEFPFGSGLAVLDAMASGCPVISMYDPKGPPQARYGGNYIGIERAITSGRREDYVALACQLLTNPTLYQEWSEHAQRRYELYSDVKAYVKRFEDIVLIQRTNDKGDTQKC